MNRTSRVDFLIAPFLQPSYKAGHPRGHCLMTEAEGQTQAIMTWFRYAKRLSRSASRMTVWQSPADSTALQAGI